MPSNEVGPSHQESLRIIHVSHSKRDVSASRNVRGKGSGSARHENSRNGVTAL